MRESRPLASFESLLKDLASLPCSVRDRKSKILHRVKRMRGGCGNIKRRSKGDIRERRKEKRFEAGDINTECTNRNAKNSAHQVRVGRRAGKFPKAR